MVEYLLLSLVSIIVLGVCGQWIAWRFRLPSILILLILGFVAGPITGLLVPDELFGSLLFPVVSLSVGIILFESGLSLQIEELRESGRPIRNLVTVGVLVTWIGSAAAAYFLAGLNLPLSFLVGALIVVTGPTVIVPLLRHIRPKGRIGNIARWEGIIVDPIGAILSVLVLETILFLQATGGKNEAIGSAVLHVVEGLLLTALVSVALAFVGTGLLVFVFYRRHVPDFLQNAVVLMVVSAAFGLSNFLQPESGLVTTTLMGAMMANQNYVSVRQISEFKEDLQVLLIGGLFIILSARLDLGALQHITAGTLLFLAALLLVVRPAAVYLASIGTDLDWKEQTFLACLAPRGIVAASVVSLFSFRLSDVFPNQAAALVPIVFLVIVGTVALYGLSALPLARYLGLADPDPQGVFILGAHSWARTIAEHLQRAGVHVLLVDSEAEHIEQARELDLPAQQVDVLDERAIDEISFSGLGYLVTLTSSSKVNALAALHFYEIFDSTTIYQLSITQEGEEPERRLPSHMRGHPLFGNEVTYASLTDELAAGGRIESISFSEATTQVNGQSMIPEEATPLFLVHENGDLFVYSDQLPPTPKPGDTLIAVVGDATDTEP